MKQVKRKCTLIISCSIFFILFVFCVLLFLLSGYLYQLQWKERLDRVEDYTNFLLTYQKENRCTKDVKFQVQDTLYVFECIDQISFTYGSTTIPFEYVMKSGYVGINTLLSHMQKVEENDSWVKYVFHKTSLRSGYAITIDTSGYYQVVTISPYD